MTLKPGVIVLLLAGIAFTSYEAYRAYSAEQQVWRLRQVQLTDSINVLNTNLKKEDTTYVHDTITLNRIVKQVKLDTILLHIHDTSYILRYIAQVDSGYKACTRIEQDCQSLILTMTQDTVVQHNKINLLTKQVNTQHWVKPALLGVLAGALATALLKK